MVPAEVELKAEGAEVLAVQVKYDGVPHEEARLVCDMW